MIDGLDWQKIDTVFLDLDGTLLDLHFDNHFWLDYVPVCYADHHGMTLDNAKTHLEHRYSEVRGRLDWYCVEFWTKDLGLNIGQLKEEVSHKIAIQPNVEHFLDRLRQCEKRVVLVTNAHPVSYSLKMKVTGLDKFFDGVINAHDLNMAKENSGFWQELQKVEPFDAQRTLFVDDNEEVLLNAEQYGFTHLLSIVKPDSQQQSRNSSKYDMVKDFSDIAP